MKNWTIDEFVSECISLRENQYTYDYNKMPEGVCNGHEVKPCMSIFPSVVIDGRIINLWKWIDTFIANDTALTPAEYIRYLLEKKVVS